MAMGRSRKTWSARPEHTGLWSRGDRITSLKKSVLRLATTEGAGLTGSEPPVGDREQGWTTPPNADSSSLGGHLSLIFIF